LVRSVVIEMVHVLFKDTPGVSFVVDQHPIGALGAYAANKPFCIAVRSGCSGRDLDHVDALGAEDCIEGISELGIPIADEEAERGGLVAKVYQQGAGGLGGPGSGRVRGHPEEMDPSGAHFHDEQDVEAAQPDGVEGEEVGG
jgi:hypothetical protein